MATAKTNILLGGKKVNPYRLSIEQRHDWHHSFEIAVSSEKMESKNTLGIDQSIQYIGQSADIIIQCAAQELRFKGVITKVYLDRIYTGDNLIVFSGYSPTYLLEDGVGVKSYTEKNIGNIASEIFGQYPANLLNPIINPQYKELIPYTVRYKETNYQFLSRMAATYGEWLFYDGQSVILGALPNVGSIDLTLGKDLDAFDYGVNLRPANFENQFYNYKENRLLKKTTKDFKPRWLSTYSKKATDVTAGIFPSSPANPVWEAAREETLFKHLAEARKSSLLSDTTFFSGKSQNPGVVIGAGIGANAINKVGTKNVLDFIGRFRVIAVRHQLDEHKDYTNQFEAIPIAVTAPPVNTNVYKPEAEPQVAVVRENNDPEKLGRIRVQFKWQTSDEMTPWIRQLTNYASGNRGLYFVPEIGDEVYVDFEQNNPDRPFMAGAKYHGKASPEFFNPDNNLKAVKTRSGHTLLFSDEAGAESITIMDKNGNRLVIDTAENNMNIDVWETINFTCRNMNFKVAENVNWNVGQNICTNAGNSIESIAANTVDMIGQNKVNLNSGLGNDFSLRANGVARLGAMNKVDFASQGSFEMASSSGTKMGSRGTIKMDGADVGINSGG